MTTADSDPTADLDSAIAALNTLLHDTDDPAAPGPLWHAWHFLQVYSAWGQRLPNTEASLKLALQTTTPGQFGFFGAMLEAYDDIHRASATFDADVFPGVVTVGHKVLDFASDASDTENGPFAMLPDLLDDDPASALALIKDLQTSVHENIDAASKVATQLGEFSSDLTDAQAKLEAVDKSIEADSAVQRATIDKDQGGEAVEGSLANLRKLIKEKKAEYDKDVVVASTSVTYAWVIPIGLLTAAGVATAYGVKATSALDELTRLQGELEKANAELATALGIHNVQELAHAGAMSALNYTNLAITQTVTVKNAWSQIASSLDYIGGKVSAMTTETDDQVRLKAKGLVKAYAARAGAKWDSLVAPLEALTKNPYIVVETATVSLSQFSNDVKANVSKAAA